MEYEWAVKVTKTFDDDSTDGGVIVECSSEKDARRRVEDSARDSKIPVHLKAVDVVAVRRPVGDWKEVS